MYYHIRYSPLFCLTRSISFSFFSFLCLSVMSPYYLFVIGKLLMPIPYVNNFYVMYIGSYFLNIKFIIYFFIFFVKINKTIRKHPSSLCYSKKSYRSHHLCDLVGFLPAFPFFTNYLPYPYSLLLYILSNHAIKDSTPCFN